MGNHRRTLRGRRRSKQTTNGNNALMMKALQAAGNGGSGTASVTATAVITATVSTSGNCPRAVKDPRTVYDPKMLKTKRCEVCGGESSLLCELCHKGFYCSDEHKKHHWKNGHRKDCFPLEDCNAMELNILSGAGHMGLGPFWKATRDIREKEFIFEEPPVMTGPGTPGDLPYEPLCLGCCIPVKDGNKCSKCKWPVCDEDCEKHPLHVTYECPIFAKNHVSELHDPFQYELLRILRCLLTKFRDPAKYATLLKLDAAMDKRISIPDLQEATNTAILFVTGNCALKFDRKTITHMCGVVDLQTQVMGDYRTAFQIYTFPSKLIHDCCANARLVEMNKPDGQHILRVMAIRPIRRGDIITVRGVDTMNPTYDRQRYLWNFFYYRCLCKCCMDPTEFGTFFSAVRCMNCMKHNKRSKMTLEDIHEGNRCLLPERPYDISEPWTCKTCKREVDAQIILDMYQGCDTEFMQLRKMIAGKNNEDKLLLLYAKVRSLEERFHPGNFQVWRVKQIIMGVMSQKLQTMDPPENWDKFKELYAEVMDISDYVMTAVKVLQPGLSLSRGRTLYDLISIRWAYIQWACIYGKAPTFVKHPEAMDFLTLVAELLIIFKYESGVSTRAIVEDVYYMKQNLNVQRMRLMAQWGNIDKLQESSDDDSEEGDRANSHHSEKLIYGTGRVYLKVHPKKLAKELDKLSLKGKK